jgi:hypothetical protein
LKHKGERPLIELFFNRSVKILLCKESREKERRIVRGRIASDKDKGAHGYWGSSDKP